MTRFSLILCTVNRDKVVRELFESFAAQQNAPSFEVILVDQNPDERLLPIVKDFAGKFPIRRYTAKPGLSRARNIGLNYADGEIIAFPDDDCTYPEHLLRTISDYLDSNPATDGISTLVTDRQGRFSGSSCTGHREESLPTMSGGAECPFPFLSAGTPYRISCSTKLWASAPARCTAPERKPIFC